MAKTSIALTFSNPLKAYESKESMSGCEININTNHIIN